MFTISIGKADVVCPDKITLTSGMVKAVKVAFVFSEEWDDFTKIVVFSNGVTDIDVSLDDYNMCYIPHEILADVGREVTCGVYGYKGDGKERVAIPTVKCSLGKVVEGVNPSGDEPSEPTPTIWEEIVNTLEKHEEAIGNPYYTEDVKLTGITTAVPHDEYCSVYIEDNSISSAGARFTIDIQGDVKIECACSGEPDYMVDFYIDAELVAQCKDGETFSFDGHVDENIQIECVFMDVRFTEFTKKIYVADILGNIDNALDSILAIQESIIGGVEL